MPSVLGKPPYPCPHSFINTHWVFICSVHRTSRLQTHIGDYDTNPVLKLFTTYTSVHESTGECWRASKGLCVRCQRVSEEWWLSRALRKVTVLGGAEWQSTSLTLVKLWVPLPKKVTVHWADKHKAIPGRGTHQGKDLGIGKCASIKQVVRSLWGWDTHRCVGEKGQGET
jgi:hypothetical protein